MTKEETGSTRLMARRKDKKKKLFTQFCWFFSLEWAVLRVIHELFTPLLLTFARFSTSAWGNLICPVSRKAIRLPRDV